MSDPELERAEVDAAKRRDEVNRGEQAKRVYENTLFKDAVEAVKDKIWDEFRGVDVRDDRALLASRLKIGCLDEILRDLQRHMETGKIAQQQLPFIDRSIEAIKRRLVKRG